MGPRRLGVIDGGGESDSGRGCQTQSDTFVLAQEGGRQMRSRDSEPRGVFGGLSGSSGKPSARGGGGRQPVGFPGRVEDGVGGWMFSAQILLPCLVLGVGQGVESGALDHCVATQRLLFR